MSNSSFKLNQFVVQHTLETLGVYSKSAENLLLATIVVQAEYPDLFPSHEGIGPYNIDKTTHCHIWDEHLAHDPDLASVVRGFASQHEFLKEPHVELATNLAYASAIVWMIYHYSGIKLPHAEDVAGLADFWSTHYIKRPNSCQLKYAFISAYIQVSNNTTCFAA